MVDIYNVKPGDKLIFHAPYIPNTGLGNVKAETLSMMLALDGQPVVVDSVRLPDPFAFSRSTGWIAVYGIPGVRIPPGSFDYATDETIKAASQDELKEFLGF